MFSKRLMEIPTWICSQKFLPIPELNFEKVVQFCSVQSLSRVRLCDPMDCSMDSLSIINSWSLLKLISIEVVMPSNHLILCHPLLLPSIFPSIRVFSNESALHIRWTKYWSFSFNISPSNEHSGLDVHLGWTCSISLQSKGPSRVFIVQLSHPYLTTGKTVALTRWTFVGKVMSLFFNMLSVITFLPRSKRLLISWLQSPSAVILEPKK